MHVNKTHCGYDPLKHEYTTTEKHTVKWCDNFTSLLALLSFPDVLKNRYFFAKTIYRLTQSLASKTSTLSKNLPCQESTLPSPPPATSHLEFSNGVANARESHVLLAHEVSINPRLGVSNDQEAPTQVTHLHLLMEVSWVHFIASHCVWLRRD